MITTNQQVTYLSDLAYQITDSNLNLPIIQDQDQIEDLYRIYIKQLNTPIFSKTKFIFQDHQQQTKQLSDLLTCQLQQNNKQNLQLLDNNYQVYNEYLFHKFNYIGPVGSGEVSMAEQNGYIIVISDSFLTIYLEDKPLLYCPTKLIFNGLQSKVHSICFTTQNSLFSCIASSSSGVLYILSGYPGQTFESNTGVQLRRQLLCNFDQGNLFNFNFFNITQKDSQLLSNIGQGYRVIAYLSFWLENICQHMVIEIRPSLQFCEVVVLQCSKQLKQFNYEYQNDCCIHIKTMKSDINSYTLQQASINKLNCSILYKKYQLITNIFKKQVILNLQCSQLYQFNEKDNQFLVSGDTQILKVQDFKVNTLYKTYLVGQNLVIPYFNVNSEKSLTYEFNEQVNQNRICLDLQLSYSFYSSKKLLNKRQDLLNSFSNSLLQDSSIQYEPLHLFIDKNVFIVQQNQEEIFRLDLQILTNYVQSKIQIQPRNKDEDFQYNPFQMSSYIFPELQYSYYLVYDVSANFTRESIEYYLFFLNQITVSFLYDDNMKVITIDQISPINEIIFSLELQNFSKYKQKFNDLVLKKYIKVEKIIYNEIEPNAVIQQSPEICFLVSEVFKQSSELFLNQNGILLILQANYFDGVIVIFQGLRQIGNFDIYIQKSQQIVQIIQLIINCIEKENFLIQNQFKQTITQYLLILDEFLVQIQLLSLFFKSQNRYSLEEFVNQIVSNEQQFLTFQQYYQKYDQFNILNLQQLLTQFSQSAIYPNVQLDSEIFGFQVSSYCSTGNFLAIAVSSLQQQLNYFMLLYTQNNLFNELSLNMIIQIYNLLGQQKSLHDSWCCLENFVFTKKVNLTQQYFNQLVALYNFELPKEKSQDKTIIDILLLLIESLLSPKCLQKTSISYQYSLIVLLEEIQHSKDQYYYDKVDQFIMYLRYLILQKQFIKFDDYLLIPLNEQLVPLICEYLQVDKISKNYILTILQQVNWEPFIDQILSNNKQDLYLDEILLHILKQSESLDNYKDICFYIYQNAPLHWSAKSMELYNLLDNIQQGTQIHKIFLESKIPFSYSLINSKDKLNELAISLIEQNQLKQFKIVVQLVDFPKIYIKSLLELSIKLQKLDFIHFFQQEFNIISSFFGIIFNDVNILPKESKYILNLLKFITQQQLFQILIVQEKYTREQLYLQYLEYQLPLYELYYDDISFETVLLDIYNIIENKEHLIEILYQLPIQNHLKLEISLSICKTDIQLYKFLCSQNKIHVNENQFIFCSYDEIISNDNLYILFNNFIKYQTNQQILENYKFCNSIFNISQSLDSFSSEINQQFEFYIPKFSLAQSKSIIESSFKLQFQFNQEDKPKIFIPSKLQFHFLCEFCNTKKQLIFLQLAYILSVLEKIPISTVITLKQEIILQNLIMYASNNYIENELYQNFLLAQISASELQNHLSSSNYNPDIVLTQFGSLLSPEFIKSTMYHSQNSALSESAIDSLQLIYSKDVIKLSKILLVHPENLICDGEVSQIQVTLEIEKLSKQGRKIDVLALLTIQESQSNLLDIVKLVIQYNLKDTQQDDNLEMFQGDSEYLTKSVKSSGWDSSSEADSVWKSDEEEQQQQSVEGWSDDDDESQKTEPNQPPENQLTEIKFYKGKKNYQNLSVQTQIFIFKILQDQPQLTTDISLTQLSLPLILSLQPDLCEKYIPQAIFQLIPQSQPINQLFEYAELLFQANLNQLSFLQFFSPFLAVSYEFRPETALEAFIVSNNINSNETIQNNAQLFVDFFKLYKIQLFDDAKYNILRQEKHAMKTAIQRYFDDDFDCGVVLFGGFQPQIQDLVQVMFLDKEDREIDFQGLIMQDLVGFSIQNQIKIAFVMQKLCSEQEIIDILYRGIDELQPVSLYKQAHLILQLKQLKKLPSVIQDKIQEEVNFLVQMSSSYKILHKSAVFEVVDMGQVTINLQYLGLGKNKKFKEIDGLQWGIEMGDGIVAIKFYENGQIGKSVLFK